MNASSAEQDRPGTEAWLRGPVRGIAPALQPVAHALIQAREEVAHAVRDFPDNRLWTRPRDAASVGFHLEHLAGVLERLFTYARGESLDDRQLSYLTEEGRPKPTKSVTDLCGAFERQVERALGELGRIPDNTLDEPRFVGRLGMPSTVRGLLFHAAEHSMRHTGQLIVTARMAVDTE